MKNLSKVIIIAVCMVALLSVNVYAQAYNYWDKIIISEDKEVPIKVQKDGVWGLIDYDGSTIVSPYWDEIGLCSDGLFTVKKGKLYGYIDIKGNVVIEPEFGQVYNFSEGLALFEKEDLYGFIDVQCNIVVQPIWKEIFEFKDGFARVVAQSGKYGVIYKDGKVIIEPVWDEIGEYNEGFFPVSLDGKMGFINKSGEIKISLVYDWVEGFINGISKVFLGGKYGLVDVNNNLITKTEWDYIGDFREDMTFVSIRDKKEQYGYINKNGKLVINPVWDNTVAFNEGLAPVMKDSLWGYIDNMGHVVIPCEYKYAGLFYNGFTVVANADGKYIFIDKFCKKINETSWDNYGNYINGKIIPVKKDGKWGFMNSQGQMLTKNIYDDVTGYFGGYIGVKKNDKWGFVDESGKLVVNTVWDKIDKFTNGMAIVSRDSKYTIINTKGENPFVSNEMLAMKKIGLLKGDDSGISISYASENSTRLQSAVMILRMNGLEDVALNFTSELNFNEAKSYSWIQGSNIMGYLKSNPSVGFSGDGKNNLNPDEALTQKQYVKVMLENLGYKQDVDFKYNDTYKFANLIGLEIKESDKFTNDDLAKTTVLFLNAKTKNGEKLIDKLIKNGTINKEDAISAGLIQTN